jgi:DNA-binding transcriptional regulator YdaS (Cro superfamily)
MYKADAVRHFGSQIAVARALGITKGAVSLWGNVVPEGSAYKLESVTGGALKVDPTLYPSTQRASSALSA